MINRRLLIVIAALILAPLLWWGFKGKIRVEPAKAAVTCSSFPCYIDPNQMQANFNQGIRGVHVGPKCDPCSPGWPCCENNTTRNNDCDHSWYQAGYALVSWECETIPVSPASNAGQYAYGEFLGLNPAITYHAYIQTCYNRDTGKPQPWGGGVAVKRSDQGTWSVKRTDWGTFDACLPGETTWIDLGTFSGRNSIQIQVQSRPLGGRSDRWVKRMRLDAETCGAWGPTIAEPACVQANGLRGRYYRDNPIGGADFNARSDGGLKLVRNDSTVNFDWGANSSPDMTKLECNNFTVAWTGWVNLSSSGDWTFYTRTDDGARLWVDGVNLVNKWQDQGPTEWSGTINRNAGWYSIRFEYYENAIGAAARLSYSGPGTGKQVIPKDQLRSCDKPVGPTLTCRFTEISSGALVGSGTAADPYKIQRGTEWIKIETTASPNPGGGTMDFKVVYPSSAEGTIRDNVPYGAGGVWQETWDDADASPPVGLPEGDGYKVRSHFDGFGSWDASDGYCYFDIVPPANAEYLISARGYITSGTRSFCWGQDSGCLLPYYPEGEISGLNTAINAPTYDELWGRFGPGTDVANLGGIGGNGVYRINGSYTVGSAYSFPAGRRNVIFINGTLTVNAQIDIPTNSAVVFIAKEIKFKKNLAGGGVPGKDETDGLYLAEGNIDTAYNLSNPGSEVTRRLIIYGALISTKGTVLLNRNLSDADNAKYAAEQIRFEPKYYALVAQYLGEAQVSWKEVAP